MRGVSYGTHYADFAVECGADGVAYVEYDVGAVVVAGPAEFESRAYSASDGRAVSVGAVGKHEVYLRGKRRHWNILADVDAFDVPVVFKIFVADIRTV